MKRNSTILRHAQLFAARFGFLTQEIFFRHICTKSRSQSYAHWKELLDAGWFFRSSRDPRVLYLSRKSRRILGSHCLSSRALMYIDHDSHVGSFLFAMNRMGHALKSWTEGELTRAPWEAYQILGTDRIAKIPDLIFDVGSDHRFFRIAVEIEKTRKSKSRYAQIALSYLDMSSVDLVIFGCESEAIVNEVRDAFRGEAFLKMQKVPAAFLIRDFEQNGSEAKLWFNEREFSLGYFLESVTRITVLTSKNQKASAA